jgi:hypothetical protein
VVVGAESSLRVATGKGLICFHELQLPGARMLPAVDFLNGYQIMPGDQLTGGKAKELVYASTCQKCHNAQSTGAPEIKPQSFSKNSPTGGT